MNFHRIPTAAAFAAAIVFGSAATAGAAPDGSPGTLGALHATGCAPVVSLDVGANVFGFAHGQAACAGQVATLAYDGPAGRTVLVALDDPTLTTDGLDVEPDCGMTDQQTDLWVGDVRDALAAERAGGPRFDSAHRLVTVSWLDGAPCSVPVVPQPEPAPPVPVSTAVCVAGTFPRLSFPTVPGDALVTLNGERATVSTAVTPWLATFPVATDTEVVSYTSGVTVDCWLPEPEATTTTAAPTPVPEQSTSTTAAIVELANPTPAGMLPNTGPAPEPWRDPMALGAAAVALAMVGAGTVATSRRLR